MSNNRTEEIHNFINTHKLNSLLSSCHLNFLFGAGVNGDLLPQMKGYIKTVDLLKRVSNKKISKNFNFEEELAKVNGVDSRNEVLESFVNEFNYFYKNIDLTNNSYSNIKKLLKSTYTLVDTTNNTIESMSKINIFSFNYDDIIENTILNKKYYFNTIKPRSLLSHSYHNVIFRNVKTLRYIPSFVVLKIHGTVDDDNLSKEKMILPSMGKYKNSELFELLFKMKSELLKSNSVLIVIGYSWNDELVNQILKDCEINGLTIIWFKYSKKDKLSNQFIGKVIEIPDFRNLQQDTSLTCSEVFDEVLNF